jgi:hypothetical protein
MEHLELTLSVFLRREASCLKVLIFLMNFGLFGCLWMQMEQVDMLRQNVKFFLRIGIARMSAQDAKIVLKLFVSSQPDLFLANV